jgi:hypothetical protein
MKTGGIAGSSEEKEKKGLGSSTQPGASTEPTTRNESTSKRRIRPPLGAAQESRGSRERIA